MSAITPESYIKLVRFDVTKENQITFADGVAQVDYFRNELQGMVLEASSYQRKDYKVRFPAGIDLIEKYNYMVVQNKPYNYKYYFYYITDMTYINDEMTEVQIKLDVFQTYQFDFTYKKCFVEREHVNSDRVGEHTVPEGLETGEYYVDSYEYYDNFDETVLVVLSSKAVDATSSSVNEIIPISSLNGITCYGKIYICETIGDLDNLLSAFSANQYSGGTESITNMYFVPKKCINWNDITNPQLPVLVYEYSSHYPMVYNYTIPKPLTLDGYSPKNKKLLSFPYCFLVGSNNSGNSNVYKYEKFTGNTCEFDFSCIPTPRSFN